MSVALIIQHAMRNAVFYCSLWPVRLYHIFPHYLLTSKIFGEKVLNIKYVFCFYVSSSSVICQTTGPKPLPKWFLHIVQSRVSSFNWQYPLLSLKPFSSFLRLLPPVLVTSICLFIFLSITCFRRQFLRKMWPIQLAFRFLISCRIGT